MKILLTGATGWIGSHVARELLCLGHEVHATVREGSGRERIADLRELKIHVGAIDALPIKPDLVISLAWIASPGRFLDSEDNFHCLEVTKRLISKVDCRVIVSGSCFEFDTQIGKLSEDSPTLPTSIYARCKDELRQILVKRRNSAWLRFFYQYGPWETRGRFVPSIIQAVLDDKDAKLSPGDQKRDYLHVEDVATAVCAVAESKLEGTVNVGSGEAVKTGDIGRIIGEIGGRPDRILIGALPYWKGEPMLIVADNSKLRSTGWAPRHSLVGGLQGTFNWWKGRS